MAKLASPILPALVATVVLSVALVTAFTTADTGARTVTASVVTDGSAYLALAANADSPNSGFVTVSSGKIVITFDGSNTDATGTGVNPDATYGFHSIVKVYNNGTDSADLEVNIGGADAANCAAALTAASDQSAATFATPTTATLTVAKGGVAYLGLEITGTSTVSDTVDCTLTVGTA